VAGKPPDAKDDSIQYSHNRKDMATAALRPLRWLYWSAAIAYSVLGLVSAFVFWLGSRSVEIHCHKDVVSQTGLFLAVRSALAVGQLYLHGVVLRQARTNRDFALTLLRKWGGKYPSRGLKIFDFAVQICNICMLGFFLWGLYTELALMQCLPLKNASDEWEIHLLISVERLSLLILAITLLVRMTAFGLNLSSSWFYLNKDLKAAIQMAKDNKTVQDALDALLSPEKKK